MLFGQHQVLETESQQQERDLDESQDARFDDLMALTPEVEKTNPRRFDLMAFWHNFKKSQKPVPGKSI